VVERGQVVPALVEVGQDAQGAEVALRVAWCGAPAEWVVVGAGIPVAVIDLAAAGGALRLDIPAVFAGPRQVVEMVEFVDRLHNECSVLLALY
jgi:hypothetical protein